MRGNGDTGNTVDSKSTVGGSNPSFPADMIFPPAELLEGRGAIRAKNDASKHVPSRRQVLRKNRKRRSALGDRMAGRLAK